jgi:hypothetical protein
MKKSTIVFSELGMLLCIIFAAILLPDKTPLRAFLAVSSEFLLIGNYLVVKAIENARVKDGVAEEHKWKQSRILEVFVILNSSWVVSQLLNSWK